MQFKSVCKKISKVQFGGGGAFTPRFGLTNQIVTFSATVNGCVESWLSEVRWLTVPGSSVLVRFLSVGCRPTSVTGPRCKVATFWRMWKLGTSHVVMKCWG